MDQSDSAGTAAPTIDMVELKILVTQERVVPLEKVSTGYTTAWSRGFGREPVRHLKFSDAVKKGVGAWDQ